MAITIDHEQARQGRYLVPEGSYETQISEAKFDTTSSGTEHIRLTLQIREDIPQSEAGEIIEFPLWKLKVPSTRDPLGYSNARLQNISRSCKIPNGATFEGLEDLLNAWKGKAIKVDIIHTERNGYTNAEVSHVYESEHPDISPGFIAVREGELSF